MHDRRHDFFVSVFQSSAHLFLLCGNTWLSLVSVSVGILSEVSPTGKAAARLSIISNSPRIPQQTSETPLLSSQETFLLRSSSLSLSLSHINAAHMCF